MSVVTAGQNKATIAKMITAVKKSYETSQQRVQTVGLLIMRHAQQYGDCDQAKDLVRAIPAHLRQGLVGWFMSYSPIGVLVGKTAAEDKSRFIKKESAKFNDFNLAAAEQDPWWEWMGRNIAEPKPLLTAGDFFKNLERVIEAAMKKAKEGTRDGDDVYDPSTKDEVVEGAEKTLNFLRTLRSHQLVAKSATVDTRHEPSVTIDLDKRTVKPDAEGLPKEVRENIAA